MLRWHHLRCVRPPASLDDAGQLTGHNNLRPIDRECVQAWITEGPTGLALFSPPSSPPPLRSSDSAAGGKGRVDGRRGLLSPTSPQSVRAAGAFFNSYVEQQPPQQRFVWITYTWLVLGL